MGCSVRFILVTWPSSTSSETTTQSPCDIMWNSSGGPRKSPSALFVSSPARSCQHDGKSWWAGEAFVGRKRKQGGSGVGDAGYELNNSKPEKKTIEKQSRARFARKRRNSGRNYAEVKCRTLSTLKQEIQPGTQFFLLVLTW